MNKYIILIDFGSTFTKMLVVDKEKQKIICTTKYPSTVDEDANIALNECFNSVEKILNPKLIDAADKYASSSAAGGLKIAVIGITANLSIAASKNAAFGAGGKIMHQASGRINSQDINKIKSSNSEIILLSGGYDNGNTSIVKHNAKMLATSDIKIPVIYSGNSSVSHEVYILMKRYNKDCYIVPNIIPEVGVINSIDTEELIRNIFLKRIIHKKGLSKVSDILETNIIPTPAAVLMAGELLSNGTSKIKGLDNLIIIDVGGATTDIHSFSENYPYEGAKIIGAKEPYSKRTVEGDLGMRESSDFFINEFNIDDICKEISMSKEKIVSSINNRLKNKKFIPSSDSEKRLDQVLASKAVYLASRRHAGTIEPVLGGTSKYVQHGKNLSKVKTIIGTGGQLVYSDNLNEILSNITYANKSDKYFMLPDAIDCKADYNYILYAVGLLSMHEQDLAMQLLKNDFYK